MEEERLKFWPNKFAALIPFAVFIAITIVLSFMKVPSLNMMIAAAVIGLMVGMFFSKNWKQYWTAVINGMSSKLAMTAVLIWLVVGIFSGILKAGHLVEGLVWLSSSTGMTGAWFTVFTFVASALFAVSTGTGFGTIAMMGSIMYPAGLLVGANPVYLAGAILSGAAFGDNLAPVSDTTIISSTSQEYTRRSGSADIGGVVRTRFKYAIIAGAIAAVLYAIVGGGGSLSIAPDKAAVLLVKYSYPKGLLMLIPAAITIFLAVKGYSIFIAVTFGIIGALVVGLPTKLFTFSDLVTVKGGEVSGVIPDGVAGMTTVSVLLIIVVAMGHLLIKSGVMEATTAWLRKKIIKSPRSSELAIWGLGTVFGILIAAINTIAIICAAPFVNEIGKVYKLHPYRRANILDAVSCSWPFFVPYGGCVLLLIGTINGAAKTYSFVVPLSPFSLFFAVFYSWAIWIIMFFASVTGWGRDFEGKDGRQIKGWFSNKVPEEALENETFVKT